MKDEEDIRFIYDRVSQRIKFFRKYRGLTQEQLAEKTTFSRGLIGNIESAKTIQTFSLAVLYSFARALDIPLELFVKENIDEDLIHYGFVDNHKLTKKLETEDEELETDELEESEEEINEDDKITQEDE